MKMKFDQSYWEHRYKEDNTGWDLGYPSPPLTTYIDQLQDKNLEILIPGAGYGHEAIYLHKKGFKNVSVVDLSKTALQNIAEKCPNYPENRLIMADFFTLQERYDLILEQTFFCALDPVLRKDYVMKMKELLKPKGKLAGVFFDFEKTEDCPPFGGSLKEYKALFEPHFSIKTLQRCHNSIKPRQGSELFFIFENTKN